MLTRAQKIAELEALDTQNQPLTREQKIAALEASDKQEQTPEEPSVYEQYIKPILKPTVEGIGAAVGGVAGTAAAPIAGTLAGAGLGYAGAKQGYEGIERLIQGKDKPLTQSLVEIPQDVATGASYEAGGQVLGKAFPAVLNTAGRVLKKGTEGVGAGYRAVTGKVGEVITGEKLPDNLQPNNFKLTPEEEALNLKYKSLGLPELRPSQIKQSELPGVPTGAQAFETQYMSKIPEAMRSQQQQEEAIRNLLDKYRTTARTGDEQIGQEIMSPIQKAKGEAGEKIGEFKKAGADVPVQEVKTITETKPAPYTENASYDAVAPKEITTTKTEVVKKPSLPISKLDQFEQGENFNKLLGIESMYQKASTAQELDALSSNVGQQISEAQKAGSYKYARKLGEIKTAIEDHLADKIEQASGIAKPKEAYATYSKLSKYTDEYMDRTTAGTPTPIKNIVNKLTSSKAELNDFIETAKNIGKETPIQVVKEEYLKNIFNSPNPATQWNKVAKSNNGKDILNTLFTPEELETIDTQIQYMTKQKSVGLNVNPSKTETSKGMKEMLVDELLGKGAKNRQLVNKYRELMGYTPKQEVLAPLKQITATPQMTPVTQKQINPELLKKIYTQYQIAKRGDKK